MVARVVRGLTALGRPDFEVGDDGLLRIDQARPGQRKQGEGDCGRVAAHPADMPRCGNGVTLDLGQPVDESRQPLGCVVILAVPGPVGSWITQPEIRRAVDDLVGQGGPAFDPAGRFTVGEREEEEVALLETVEGREPQFGPSAEVGCAPNVKAPTPKS